MHFRVQIEVIDRLIMNVTKSLGMKKEVQYFIRIYKFDRFYS